MERVLDIVKQCVSNCLIDIVGTLTMIAATTDYNNPCVAVSRSLLCHYAFRPCEAATSLSENWRQVAAVRPPFCTRNCEELESDVCRTALEFVKQHLEPGARHNIY